MKKVILPTLLALTVSASFAASAAQVCENFGPQTPRDIDSVNGTNPVVYSKAPSFENMNLCNIHFHENAEHKAKDFAIFAGEGKKGYGTGYQCNISQSLSKAELKPTKESICAGKYGDLQPGDTIEVHWVHTSCDVEPGPTLGACVSDSCANPNLRVETQVFTLVNDSSALDFNELQTAGALPKNTGKPVEFLGSTTGPSFDDQTCSPYQVTWSVRPKCAKLDINTVGQWCKDNIFDEDHAHGVRKLVTNPKLLSEIK
ncbi:cadmium carbonic anhydrase [Catenovulum sp. SM1970]|uniref:delta-class carbonic anhydrase n=1 Tax=Marinifaba aquimaris TaxID=2741323 RepID=UPI001571A0D5|nr:delta-class carbonic anhydrase [Marinifaba aquimaris]NTS76408.1 cadmium carbonic anhydrase [Marinifaba aquimaris]